jgi:hypothetical protein
MAPTPVRRHQEMPPSFGVANMCEVGPLGVCSMLPATAVNCLSLFRGLGEGRSESPDLFIDPPCEIAVSKSCYQLPFKPYN